VRAKKKNLGFFFSSRSTKKDNPFPLSLPLSSPLSLPGVELDSLGELGRRRGEHGGDGVPGVERDLLGGDLRVLKWRRKEGKKKRTRWR
jgi:hypothetical protein